MAAPQYLKPGSSLLGGKYRIVKALGHGTFGLTYLATTKLSSQGNLGALEVEVNVAIKEFFMRDINQRDTQTGHVGGSEADLFVEYRRRFRKEAHNLTKLEHPGIIRVIDVFDENDTSYYAMEFVDGRNLDDYIAAEGPMKEADALAAVKKIGEALEYMHSRHMLHLDIKPKNIMRRPDGSFKVIDFGLSKIIGADGESESSSNIGLGTPGFAPLEQATYRPDGSFPATLDIYALGATLFKMLTGYRPAEPTLILNQGFPLADLQKAGVSEPTVKAIRKAMALASAERYQTVGQFLAALSHGDRTADDTRVRELTDDSADIVIVDTPEKEVVKPKVVEKPEIVKKPEVKEKPKEADKREKEKRPSEKKAQKMAPVAPEPVIPKDAKKSKRTVPNIVIALALMVLCGVIVFFAVRKNEEAERVDDPFQRELTVQESGLDDKGADMDWTIDGDKGRYTGPVRTMADGKNVPNGRGKIVFDNGDTYEGLFLDGDMNGDGVYTMPDGSIFDGTFSKNVFTAGKYTDGSTGEYFVGSLKDGQPSNGTWYYKNGTKKTDVK